MNNRTIIYRNQTVLSLNHSKKYNKTTQDFQFRTVIIYHQIKLKKLKIQKISKVKTQEIMTKNHSIMTV
jgi:hypothetical protein